MKFLELAMAVVFIAAPATAAPKRTKPARGTIHVESRKPRVDAAQVLRQEGMRDLDAGRLDAAIQKFSQTAKIKPDGASFFLLGYAHFQRAFRGAEPDPDDALETINAYSTALALDPQLKSLAQPYRLYHGLALSYETLKADDKALKAYRMAFASAPDNPMIPLYAARLRQRMGQPDQAASNLGLSLRKARRLGKERLIAETIKNDPFFAVLRDSPAAQARLAQVFAEDNLLAAAAPADDGTLRDAVADRDTARERKPPARNPAALEAIDAGDEQFKFRRYRPAINAYAEALRLDGAAPSLSPLQLAVVYERMGTSYNKLGLCSEAILSLQRCLQQMPANAAAHYQIALAHSVSGRFSESLKALKAAWELAPTAGERRRYMLMAKTDPELAPVRDLRGFGELVGSDADAVAGR
ncbi:MAG: hypothetical protein PHF00_02210 [Elusimicrobia bacterium]|nr:hypothetical protein [Elusimicrobiota bacterium]